VLHRKLIAVACVAFEAFALVGCATSPPQPNILQLAAQVAATERAFAKTMADRDFNAFTTFVADEAVFFGGTTVLRGKDQVTRAWRPYFVEAAAPFSWEPKHVEVLTTGTLAQSTGPVFDASGTQVGSFNSIWRQEKPGVWRIVFDNGCQCVSP